MHALLAAYLAAPTPTPESPQFPVDPVLLLRDEWPCLVVYYFFAIVSTILLWRTLKASRFTDSLKPRLITAAVLAAIFTPGDVSDFFFFTIPGPAAAGLFMLLIGLAFAAASNPGELFFKPALWTMIRSYYFLPLLVGFAIAYSALWIYSRSRQRATSSA